ncbi:hypothetical protein Tco_1516987 [Tanacetum coccineum]
MVDLKFVDQHNIVACLEKSEGNVDFHKIVDFLTASSVHYALTIALAKPFYDVYQTPAHTKMVFTNMKRKGKDFSGRLTPLFASMLAPPVVEGKGSGQPSEPLPTNVPIPNIADEAVFKKWDDRVVRATTTPASLDAAQSSGNISKTQSTAMSNDPLSQEISLGGNTPGSDEERIKQDDLMDFVPPTPHDSPLSGGHTLRSDAGDCSRVGDQNAEKRRNTAEQTTTTGDTVNTASIDVSVVGPLNVSIVDPSTSTVGDIFEDEMMTIVDTLVAIRSTRPRTTLVFIHDVEEEPRRSTPVPTSQPSSKDKGKALMVEPEKPSKNLRKAQIQMDEELAIRLHKEEKAELERMQRERVVQEEASNDALIAEFDNVQARMEADALLAARLQEKEREQFSIDEQARFLVEIIAERKRFFAAQRAEQIRNKPPTKIQLRYR